MIAELIGVSKHYGRVAALQDVNLLLEIGRVTALLGPNGAGKTTAVKLLLGLTRPTSGAIALRGSTGGQGGKSAGRWRAVRHPGRIFVETTSSVYKSNAIRTFCGTRLSARKTQ